MPKRQNNKRKKNNSRNWLLRMRTAQELKRKDYAADLDITTSWAEYSPSDMSQGSDSDEKVGRKISVVEVGYNGYAYAADSYNMLRLVVGIYSGETTTPLYASGETLTGPLDRTHGARRYLIRKLNDRLVPLIMNSDTTAFPVPTVLTWKYRFPRPLAVWWGDETTTYPDKRIIFSFLSDSGASSHPHFVGTLWIKYTDA